jgi:hypothetical protein
MDKKSNPVGFTIALQVRGLDHGRSVLCKDWDWNQVWKGFGAY